MLTFKKVILLLSLIALVNTVSRTVVKESKKEINFPENDYYGDETYNPIPMRDTVFYIGEQGTIEDVTVEFSFEHEDEDDIYLEIVGPSGYTVEIYNGYDCGGEDFAGKVSSVSTSDVNCNDVCDSNVINNCIYNLDGLEDFRKQLSRGYWQIRGYGYTSTIGKFTYGKITVVLQDDYVYDDVDNTAYDDVYERSDGYISIAYPVNVLVRDVFAYARDEDIDDNYYEFEFEHQYTDGQQNPVKYDHNADSQKSDIHRCRSDFNGDRRQLWSRKIAEEIDEACPMIHYKNIIPLSSCDDSSQEIGTVGLYGASSLDYLVLNPITQRFGKFPYYVMFNFYNNYCSDLDLIFDVKFFENSVPALIYLQRLQNEGYYDIVYFNSSYYKVVNRDDERSMFYSANQQIRVILGKESVRDIKKCK